MQLNGRKAKNATFLSSCQRLKFYEDYLLSWQKIILNTHPTVTTRSHKLSSNAPENTVTKFCHPICLFLLMEDLCCLRKTNAKLKRKIKFSPADAFFRHFLYIPWVSLVNKCEILLLPLWMVSRRMFQIYVFAKWNIISFDLEVSCSAQHAKSTVGNEELAL